MFAPANQAHFTLSLEGVEHDFKVLEFRGREAISQPYRFDLELVSERPDLDLESLLHRRPSSPSRRMAAVSTGWCIRPPRANPASA